MERTRVLIHFLPSFWHFLPILLYAETHYRFRYFFSFLRKREPEIIADAPHRIEPNFPLPILILVKDAHLFPITVKGINVILQSNGKTVGNHNLLQSTVKIKEKLWWCTFEIPLGGLTGEIECDVVIEITDGKRQRFYHNDNHRTSSRRPLKIFVASMPLPKFDRLHLGECHSHSSYSDDQVEFGSPLQASVPLCRALGLSFLCATDHSYDLDDSPDNYLINDPELPKYRLFQQEVDELNAKLGDFAIVRGEEVTCRSSEERNIHLLLLGNRTFFHGSGDGAERWFKTRSEYSISDILAHIDHDTLSFAAHPKESVPLFQQLLLCRGKWHKQDFSHSKLTGIQFVNGQLSDGFVEGYKEWIDLLLIGKKVFAVAGNDAHGNFNRFRQIRVPFLKIRESRKQLFGKMRTGVFLETLTEESILKAIQSGNVILSDGPVINLLVDYNGQNFSSIGKTFVGARWSIVLEVLSSNEFGTIDSLKLFSGRIGKKETELITRESLKVYSLKEIYRLEVQEDVYIRAEAWTSSKDSVDRQSHFCITNPIWFKPK